MSGYLVEFTDPKGGKRYAVNGHEHRALHLSDRTKAEVFPTKQRANQWLGWNFYCMHAFWSSERAYAAQVAREHKGWTAKIVRET